MRKWLTINTQAIREIWRMLSKLVLASVGFLGAFIVGLAIGGPSQKTEIVGEPITPGEIKVVQGDIIDARGYRYRLAPYDTPDITSAKCAVERSLGRKAKERLQAIVDAGGLNLTEISCSCRDGTQSIRECNGAELCGVLTAKGENVGTILIRGKLARPYYCGESNCPKRVGWCKGEPI